MAARILMMAGVARSVYGQWKLRKLISSLVMVAILTIMSVILVCAVLIGAFFAAYFAMTYYGLEPLVAAGITSAAFLVTVAGFIAASAVHIKRLQEMHFFNDSSVTSKIGGAVDAFMEGLMTEEKR